jgi:hypothetical protein
MLIDNAKRCNTYQPFGASGFPVAECPFLADRITSTRCQKAATRHYVCGRKMPAKSQFVRKSPARRLPQCRGIGRCFPAWCDQAATERPADSSCACRSGSLWFAASSACRKPTDRARQLRPSDARSLHTAWSRHAVSGSPCSGRGTGHSVAETSPATPRRRLWSARSVQTVLAATSSSGSPWPGGEPDFHA